MLQKNSILDVVMLTDLPLFAFEFIKGSFSRYLSVKHKGQLVTHGKTVKVANI